MNHQRWLKSLNLKHNISRLTTRRHCIATNSEFNDVMKYLCHLKTTVVHVIYVCYKSHLRAIFDVMALIEAQVAQVVGWRSFVGFPWL